MPWKWRRYGDDPRDPRIFVELLEGGTIIVTRASVTASERLFVQTSLDELLDEWLDAWPVEGGQT